MLEEDIMKEGREFGKRGGREGDCGHFDMQMLKGGWISSQFKMGLITCIPVICLSHCFPVFVIRLFLRYIFHA